MFHEIFTYKSYFNNNYIIVFEKDDDKNIIDFFILKEADLNTIIAMLTAQEKKIFLFRNNEEMLTVNLEKVYSMKLISLAKRAECKRMINVIYGDTYWRREKELDARDEEIRRLREKYSGYSKEYIMCRGYSEKKLNEAIAEFLENNIF